MSVNMKDVADLAGVSQRTVSNVVNDYVHVKPATRRRVQEAITTLKYRPNINAQKLRQGRSGILALALPEIAVPYFADLANYVQQVAEKRGVTVLIDQTGGNPEREFLVLDGYRSNLIDGLIFSPLAITPEQLMAHDLDFPVVLLGERIGSSEYLHVSVDNVAAATQATSHLLAQGRRRIAVVGAPSEFTVGPGPARMRGYEIAMQEADVTVDPRLVIQTTQWTRAEGYAIARQLVADTLPFDAVFCFNDLLGVGVLKGLLDEGVAVPEKVSVVGWDDNDETLFSTPTLSTISPDKRQLARVAVDGLLGLIAGTSEIPNGQCDYSLVVRGSSRQLATL
ncbi:LacI family DNA-binding transcriptional regulator [Cryobacterium sp. TMT4-31]|uniref:LacI family DNA-binding transcriptional regulator n=1 Tax=Cryobacterium sp. TMT4-31 TaxID=1259259 RepID=UPI00106B937A|nr:LacI family DNA-binding transcriptional regulator [Cryobacterium sp. TMT4-31]TFC90055.1 LacI family transcriptional regulator [Cryobacterium sp. TMT4-31]